KGQEWIGELGWPFLKPPSSLARRLLANAHDTSRDHLDLAATGINELGTAASVSYEEVAGLCLRAVSSRHKAITVIDQYRTFD
ncbi:MAG: hypothetical protein WBE01_13960, partial [Methyloceanibacter sp.]